MQGVKSGLELLYLRTIHDSLAPARQENNLVVRFYIRPKVGEVPIFRWSRVRHLRTIAGE